MSPRTRNWTLAAAGVALAACAAALLLVDWNLMRGWVEQSAYRETGRRFAIHGDLHVELSAQPRIRAEHLVLGNAPWGSEPNMAEVDRVEARIDLLELLKGRLVLPELELSRPRLLLEKNADGEVNWKFETKRAAPEWPTIGSLRIAGGTLVYREPAAHTDILLRISSAEPQEDERGQMMDVSGEGRFKDMPFTLRGRSGEALGLGEPDRPYPVQAEVSIGATRASVRGTLTDPPRLTLLDLDLVLQGRDLAALYPILGVPIPPTPAYRLAGHLLHQGREWRLSGLRGVVGGSDLAGDFTVERGPARNFIRADLTSNRLDMKDLGGVIGVAPDPRKADEFATRPGRVLPDRPYSIEKLRAADADVRLRGRHVVLQKLPLQDMRVHLRLNDGRLVLDPLAFGVAEGSIVSRITLDARRETISTRLDAEVRRLRLDELIPITRLTEGGVGQVDGRARLVMAGNSIARMLGSANGEVALFANEGEISDLAVRLANLDLAHAATLWLGGDRKVRMNCMVAAFAAQDGHMRPRIMAIDTDHGHITGAGDIDFKQETLDLRLSSESKDRSLVALRGPILIRGSFAKPTASADLKNASLRGGLAMGLGVLATPLAALVPLVDLGGTGSGNCPALMAAAERSVRP